MTFIHTYPVVLAMALILSGCNGDDAENKGPGDDSEQDDDKTVEIFSWWTAGGEYDALNALIVVFNEQYPSITIANSFVTGGGGFNAREVLSDMFRNGAPPEAFQVHAGHELTDSWVKEGYVEPVTDLFEEKGWLDTYPPGLIEILSADGEIWSVPVNIHRSNILWYDKQFFDDNALSPPRTFEAFFELAAEINALGVTPLALGDNGIWASTHLFESVLLGAVGKETYKDLWEGTANWTSSDVTSALETFVEMLAYVNPDHAELSWDEAAGLVGSGDAAMTIMGDWIDGYFKSVGLLPGHDFGWAPSPQTDGSFVMLSDSFALSKDSPNKEGAHKWLSVCGSKEGQDAFNPIKGAIPVHPDVDHDNYDTYQHAAMDDFASLDILPSAVHGAAVSEEWLALINEAIDGLISYQNIEATQEALAEACASVNVCN